VAAFSDGLGGLLHRTDRLGHTIKLFAPCARIAMRFEVTNAPKTYIEIHPIGRKRIPVVDPVTVWSRVPTTPADHAKLA
jgi:hypothetical protein